MMQREEHTELTGRTFGRWTVLDQCSVNERGEKKLMCRCECGTERFVLQRALLYGKSRSCGCRGRRDISLGEELTGRRFGMLTVLERRPPAGHGRAVSWLCQCDCGNELEAETTDLLEGRMTGCGCKKPKGHPFTDVTGQRFHRLTALYPLNERDRKGNVIWHCRCDCGNELDVSYNNLRYSNMRSCGCRRREHYDGLSDLLTHVDGTSVDILRSRKVPKNNTTGVKGVYLIRGRYVAKIVFQKKQYLLGSYDDLASAQRARQEADELIATQVVAYYEKWKARAQQDPEWAKANPVRIQAGRDEENRLKLDVFPVLEDAGN